MNHLSPIIVAMLCLAATVLGSRALSDGLPPLEPVRLFPETDLLTGGQPTCTVVFPGSDAEFAGAALSHDSH